MSETEKVRLGVMPLVEAKRLKETLAELGMEIELGHNEETCTRGCRVTVEIWAEPRHIPKIQEVLKAESSKIYEGLDFDPKQVDQVFDPGKETAVCPACGTQFSTKSDECPECGLAFRVK